MMRKQEETGNKNNNDRPKEKTRKERSKKERQKDKKSKADFFGFAFCLLPFVWLVIGDWTDCWIFKMHRSLPAGASL
jgi:hypothetical protein